MNSLLVRTLLVFGFTMGSALAQGPKAPQPQAGPNQGQGKGEGSALVPAAAPAPASPNCPIAPRGEFLAGTYDLTLHPHTSAKLAAVPQGVEHYELTLEFKNCSLTGHLVKVGENHKPFDASARVQVPVTWKGRGIELRATTIVSPSEPSRSQRQFFLFIQNPPPELVAQEEPAFYGLWREGEADKAAQTWGPLKFKRRVEAKEQLHLVSAHQSLCEHITVDETEALPPVMLTHCALGSDGASAFVTDAGLTGLFGLLQGFQEIYDAQRDVRTRAPLSRASLTLHEGRPLVYGELFLDISQGKAAKAEPDMKAIIPLEGTIEEGSLKVVRKEMALLKVSPAKATP